MINKGNLHELLELRKKEIELNAEIMALQEDMNFVVKEFFTTSNIWDESFTHPLLLEHKGEQYMIEFEAEDCRNDRDRIKGTKLTKI